jgi:3-oxoacyl-[acyl-carrier protein] reductase
LIEQASGARSATGRVALITGAAHGMGRATAVLFASEGARVAATDRDELGAISVAKEIEAAGGIARARTLDVVDSNAINSVTRQAAVAFGGIDYLINNAGVSGRLPIDDPKYENNWGRLLNVLLTSQQRMIRAALPILGKSNAARIVNIASTEALGGNSEQCLRGCKSWHRRVDTSACG